MAGDVDEDVEDKSETDSEENEEAPGKDLNQENDHTDEVIEDSYETDSEVNEEESVKYSNKANDSDEKDNEDHDDKQESEKKKEEDVIEQQQSKSSNLHNDTTKDDINYTDNDVSSEDNDIHNEKKQYNNSIKKRVTRKPMVVRKPSIRDAPIKNVVTRGPRVVKKPSIVDAPIISPSSSSLSEIPHVVTIIPTILELFPGIPEFPTQMPIPWIGTDPDDLILTADDEFAPDDDGTQNYPLDDDVGVGVGEVDDDVSSPITDSPISQPTNPPIQGPMLSFGSGLKPMNEQKPISQQQNNRPIKQPVQSNNRPIQQPVQSNNNRPIQQPVQSMPSSEQRPPISRVTPRTVPSTSKPRLTPPSPFSMSPMIPYTIQSFVPSSISSSPAVMNEQQQSDYPSDMMTSDKPSNSF